ncbi:glycine cleavage system protein GcvH [bacterium]|nr:glycine cleavage system protein GcvH [bacterium]
MNVPEELLYTEDHEWVRVENDIAVVGITDYAQGELGDIVFIEMPDPGEQTTQSEPCASIEAVKAVSDLYAPVSGEVTEINEDLVDDPQQVNTDPYSGGWILKIKIADTSELEDLMSAEEYQNMIS